MTIQELIEDLKKYPPDMSVVVYDYQEDPASLRYRGYKTYKDFKRSEEIALKRTTILKNVNGKYKEEEFEGEYLEAGKKNPADFTAVILI